MTSAKGKWDPRKISFVNRNLVAIIMIPSIIGVHYGWLLLQENEALVKKDERIELPLISGAKLLWKKVYGDEEDRSRK